MPTTDLADAFGAAIRDIREELITKGYFGRNPSGAGAHDITIDAPEIGQPTIGPADAGDRALAIESGWSFPGEPERERDDPAHDLDR